MRLPFLTLVLCTGIAAWSQSAAPAPVTPDRLGQIPSAFTRPLGDSSKLPSSWRITNVAQLETAIMPSAEAARRWDDAKIDPKMIVHPPQSSIGVQPPGSLVAQNEYPNLRMLPIEASSAKPIPTQWSLLQIKLIPIQWPLCKVGPVDCATLAIGQNTKK